MKRPLFSFLIPTHNRSEFLRTALESLERQTVRPEGIEVIVSDDGSADDTRAVLDAYRRRWPAITAYHQERNLGVARNHGFLLEKASGEYVHLLCDDDAVPPDFLSTHLDLFAKDPRLDLVFGDLELRTPDFKPIKWLKLDSPAGAQAGPARCRQQLLSHHMVQAVVYRRALLQAAGGWREEVGCHLDCTAFCRSALRARGTYHIPRPMLHFRISPGSFSHSLSTRDQGQLARWYRRKLDLLREDAGSIWPEGLPFLREMYAWHAKGVMGYLELELAHRHISGAAARRAMGELLAVFPEGGRDRMRLKLWLASVFGTGWLKLLRRALGKPDRYDSDLALFNSFPSSGQQ